jgi:hypothetical protein
MNKQFREFERASGLEIYGLGKDRAKWEAAMEKFAKLIVQDCASIVENQGAFLRFDTLAKKIKQHFGVEE